MWSADLKYCLTDVFTSTRSWNKIEFITKSKMEIENVIETALFYVPSLYHDTLLLLLIICKKIRIHDFIVILPS